LAIDTAGRDVETATVFAYRERYVYPYLRQQKRRITKLQRSNASRANVASVAKRDGVQFITGSGHGTQTKFLGHSGGAVFEIGKYKAGEVKDRIIHLMSCRSGEKLGPDMVKKGGRAFFGYSADLTILEGHEDVLYECDSEIDRGLAEGLTVADVHQRTVSLFEAHIDRLMSTGRLEDAHAATFLSANLDFFCTPVIDPRFGDAQARLKD
jgi:hypothetical protein